MERLRGIAPELRLLNLRTQDYPGGLVKTQIAATLPPHPIGSDWNVGLA